MAIRGFHFNKKLWLIVITVSIIKIICLCFISSFNTFEDVEIAQNFLKHHSFFYFNDGVINHSFQFPVYPILLSLAFSVHNAPVAGALLNVAFLSISSLLLHSLLEKCKKWNWINLSENLILGLSVLPLLHPAFVYYELICVHPFAHDFLFLIFSLYTCLLVLKEENTSSVEKGLMLGLAIIARGTFIVFPIILLMYIALKKKYKKVRLVLLGMLLMVSPWLLHNFLSDDIIGFTSTSGKILWKGTLHESEGGNYLDNGKNYYSALSDADLDTLGKSTVKEQNEFFMNRSWAQCKQEPLHILKMFAVKLKNFWFYSNNMAHEYPPMVKKALPYLRFINLIFIVTLLYFSVKISHTKWLFIALAFSSFQCFFYFEARHRLLIEPLLFVILIHLLVSSKRKKAIA